MDTKGSKGVYGHKGLELTVCGLSAVAVVVVVWGPVVVTYGALLMRMSCCCVRE